PGPRLEVQPVVQRRLRVVSRAVVREDVAPEPPVALEDLLEQVVVLAGIEAVDEVVGAHDGADVRLLDGRLEVRQVDLTEGPLLDVVVDDVAASERPPAAWRAGVAALPAGVGALLAVARAILHAADASLRPSPLY